VTKARRSLAVNCLSALKRAADQICPCDKSTV
jgi:hypothetical protein